MSHYLSDAGMAKVLTVVLALIFLAIAAVFVQPADEKLKGDIKIITSRADIESHLSQHKATIGSDFDGYRNHVYRVLCYALHYLHGDTSKLNVIAVALVYHDIGLWTDKNLAYLEPS